MLKTFKRRKQQQQGVAVNWLFFWWSKLFFLNQSHKSSGGKFVKLLRAARNNHLLKPNHFGQSALFFVVAFFLASLDAAMTMDIVAGWEQEIVCLIDSALVFTEGYI
nr:hypothetical protein Iba_chr11aCG13470 [Ipomoea batatas]